MKLFEAMGGGSAFLGIIFAPFFIIGVIQVFRGFCSIFDNDLKKMDTKGDSILNYFYIPATVIGYIAVFFVVYSLGLSAGLSA